MSNWAHKGQVGLFYGRNGTSQIREFYICDYTDEVYLGAWGSRGKPLNGGMAMDKDHFIKVTVDFLEKLGYKVEKA